MARRADLSKDQSADGRISGGLRCYFHLVGGSEAVHDTEGLVVVDLDEARAQAHEALLDLAQSDPDVAATLAGWRLDVCDESGAVLFSVRLNPAGAPYWLPRHTNPQALRNPL